jgi:hypothetical protein
VPVLDQPVSISAGLVPGPALFPSAGAAERPQEILYKKFYKYILFLSYAYIFQFKINYKQTWYEKKTKY